LKRAMVLLTDDLDRYLDTAAFERKESRSHIIRKALAGHLSRLGYGYPESPGSHRETLLDVDIPTEDKK
jgi:hypothetical protein